MSQPPNTLVELERFTLTAGGKVLLKDAAARFEPGKVTLIVGPSGAGKSLLLRSIAGLMDASAREVKTRGSLKIGGREMIHEAGPRSVGVVFQQFALFDELTPNENVRFAHAHQPRARRAVIDETDPAAILTELRVPTTVRTSALSGGQQQRLAIARTLTYNPEVILYDEPTSGLDPATAEQVAKLIRTTHDSHPKTSIVVTHDYESLAPIADAVYLLDVRAQSLRPVERDRWAHLKDDLHPPLLVEPPAPPGDLFSRVKRWFSSVKSDPASFLVATSHAFEATLLLPLRLIPLWRSPAWGLRYLLHYLRLVSGFSAWLYIWMIGVIVGFVTTHFTFKFIPSADYTEPLIIEDLLKAVGYALYRILIPIFATVLIAARCGAAVASDIGGKTYGRQIDALRSFGVAPERYLLTNILYAFLLGVPFLTAMCFIVAKATSIIVFTAAYPDMGPAFWELHFHRELIMPGDFFYVGTGWMVAKVLACAAGIALIAYHIGAKPKNSSSAVSSGITSAILWGTLYVLVVHFVFAFIEFEKAQ
jgi:ABC-type transporter Mla maintaining outer membrane lipid asymmetry ATPase subunit MlaF/ABC-type transporter Mla maintaining outer membrane lipid asymmetry permease subunit MlaE